MLAPYTSNRIEKIIQIQLLVAFQSDKVLASRNSAAIFVASGYSHVVKVWVKGEVC